jgi:hypothetical protein
VKSVRQARPELEGRLALSFIWFTVAWTPATQASLPIRPNWTAPMYQRCTAAVGPPSRDQEKRARHHALVWREFDVAR